MIKGMSASVSMALSQRLFPRAISQAIGIPASRSSAATIKAIMKLFWMAPKARFTSAGCCKNELDVVPFDEDACDGRNKYEGEKYDDGRRVNAVFYGFA